MAKIYLDEIIAALSFSTFKTLEQDTLEAESLKKLLNSFEQESNSNLSGKVWDNYRTNIVDYETLLDQRKELANSISIELKRALESLKDYMEDYSMLDSSRLEEYKRQQQVCNNSINTLENMIAQMIAAGENEDNLVDVKNQLYLAKTTLNEINKIIEKIKGVDDVYQKAMTIIQSINDRIIDYNKEVLSVIPSGKYSYTK